MFRGGVLLIERRRLLWGLTLIAPPSAAAAPAAETEFLSPHFSYHQSQSTARPRAAMDTHDYRSSVLDPLAYHHHHHHHHLAGGGSGGRMCPPSPTGGCYGPPGSRGGTGGSYPPLQPLPPIGSVSEKFVNGTFGFMTNGSMSEMDGSYGGGGSGYKANGIHPSQPHPQTTHPHHHHQHHHHSMTSNSAAGGGFVHGLGVSPSNSMYMVGAGTNGIYGHQGQASSLYGSPAYGHLPGTHKQDKGLLSMSQSTPYDPYTRGVLPLPAAVPSSSSSSRILQSSSSPNPYTTNLFSLHCSPPRGASLRLGPGTLRERSSPTGFDELSGKGGHHHQHHHHHHLEMEEINTKDLAQKISSELKRYSIPQAVFAQRVLCRSQGTLSDLLRNPKPWSKLKSGRETFRRMWKWLQEPEFQRMSALRLAGKLTGTQTVSSSFKYSANT